MYVRRTSSNAVADPQPNSQLVQDQYGNSFRNWCVDYIHTDVNNHPDVAPASGAVNVTDLDPQYFDQPIYATVEKDGTKYHYWVTGYTGIPASQRSWADEEEARDNVNTPWAKDGVSDLMAEKYQWGDVAFIAKPGGFNGPPAPANATYVKPLPEPSIQSQGGLLYYQGDTQLHWTAMDGSRKDVKVVFFLGTVADAPSGLDNGCADQDLFNILDLWSPVTYPDVGVPRTPSPYNQPPLVPSGFLDNVILDPETGLASALFLGLSQDRDLVIVTDDNSSQALLLEDDTQVLAGVAYNHNNP